jgi:uncharacterized protein YkwD
MRRVAGRFRWTLAVLGLLIAAAALPATAGVRAAGSDLAAQRTLDNQLLSQVNALREERGLRSLRLSSELSAAARLHSREMAEDGFFGHDSRDGATFWQRIERFYRSEGYRVWGAGENLVWASPDVTADEALTLWLGSPRHRAVLLDAHWQEIGLSAVHAGVAPGAFKGREVTIVTADFGLRTD